LTWAASTDNVGVAGYDVLRATGSGAATVVGTATGTTFEATGLTGSTTYTFTVRARDAAGNVSTSSPGRTVTTPPGGGGTGTCSGTYRLVNSWSGGFQGEVVVRNTGTATITAWTVAWALASGSAITQLWNGRLTVASGAASVQNETHNGTLGAGATTTFGFTGTGPATVPPDVSCS
jgi:hypothetical protein